MYYTGYNFSIRSSFIFLVINKYDSHSGITWPWQLPWLHCKFLYWIIKILFMQVSFDFKFSKMVRQFPASICACNFIIKCLLTIKNTAIITLWISGWGRCFLQWMMRPIKTLAVVYCTRLYRLMDRWTFLFSPFSARTSPWRCNRTWWQISKTWYSLV